MTVEALTKEKTDVCPYPIVQTGEEIHEIMLKSSKEFWDPGWMWGYDTNLNQPRVWKTAKLRVLMLFLSTGETRAVSSTDAVVNNLIKDEYGDDVFFDICYLPLKENIEKFEKLELPMMFGDVSHRPAQDYDIVFISNATVDEKINLIHMLRFSNIPLWKDQRMERDDLPLFIMAGNSADMVEMLVGESIDGKHASFIDTSLVGYAEAMIKPVFDILLNAKEKGYHKTDKKKVIEDLYALPYHYNPSAYSCEYNEDNISIKKIETLDPLAPDIVYWNRPDDIDTHVGFERKLIRSGGHYTAVDIQISQGCSSGGACTFCKEAHVAGGWREKSIAKLDEEMRIAKSYCLPDSVSFYSFNGNYYSRYVDMMYFASSHYSKIGVIGMRADVIGVRPDYFHIDKGLGLQRITVGIEGCSEKIRNGYLNKCLSELEILACARTIFEMRLMELKLFMICTGRETMEDFIEFKNLMLKLYKLRDEMGAKTSLRVSTSVLCYYPELPIAWEERTTIKNLMAGIKSFTPLMKMLKPLGVRLRFSSRGRHPVVPQYLLDIGRNATAVIEHLAINFDTWYYRNYRDSQVEELVRYATEERNQDVAKLWEKRDDDWIFPGATISTISEAYLFKAKEYVEKVTPMPHCLATAAKPEVRPCHDCGYCPDSDAIKARTQRTFENKYDAEDVLVNVSMNMPRERLRVVMEFPKKYDFLSKDALFRYHFAAGCREVGMDYSDAVHSVSNSSTKWFRKNNCGEQISGQVVFDVLYKKKVDLEKLKAGLEAVAKRGDIICSKFVNAYWLDVKSGLKFPDYASYVITFPTEARVLTTLRAFNGKVKVADKGLGGNKPMFVWKDYKGKIPEPLYISKGGKTFVFVSLPLDVNPHAFMMLLSGKSYHDAIKKYSIKQLNTYRPSGTACACGIEETYTDFATGQPSKHGWLCRAKTILTQLR